MCLRGARFARNFFEKSFESLPRMIKSSTRLGVGQFFFETAELVAAVSLFRCSEFVSSRALRAQKCCKNFSKNSEKFANMHQIPPSSGEPGGASLILGPPWYIVLHKGPHIIDSLKSKNFSNFFSQKCEKSENFQSWIWKFATTSSDHHAAEFLKKSLWKFLKNSWKILENFKVCQKRLQKISTKSCKMLQTFCKSVELLYGKFRFVIEYWVPASKSKYWPILSQSRKGSFSAVSTPIFASKYSLESSRRDLHNALLCTDL